MIEMHFWNRDGNQFCFTSLAAQHREFGCNGVTALKIGEFSEENLYEIYTADSTPSEFSVFESMKSLWDSKRPTKALPAWKDFEIRDFEGWYGWLAVADIVSISPYDAVYRLWGTKWTDLCYADYTGKLYSEQFASLDRPSHTAENLETQLRFWEEMSKTTHIAMGNGVMSWLEPHHSLFNKDFRDLTLPLLSYK